MSQRPRGKMILADGSRFDGYLTGAAASPGWQGPAWGEVVFNTSMTGYQEVITDPSYAGQVVVMTYPQIGNYGVTAADSEKPTTAARALVVHDLQEFFSPGPGRVSLESFMVEQNLPGMTGVDTRAITQYASQYATQYAREYAPRYAREYSRQYAPKIAKRVSRAVRRTVN